MINQIVNNIKLSTFGRQKKGADWFIPEKLGLTRIYYIHSGHGSLKYGDAVVRLEPGYIYCFPHLIKFNPIPDEGSFIDHTFFDFYLPIYISKDVVKIKPYQIPIVNNNMKCLIEIADKHPRHRRTDYSEFYDVVVCHIASLMFFLEMELPSVKFVSDYRIQNTLNYIHRNYHKNITTKELALESKLNESYFIRLFKATIGISPYQYIKYYKLNAAVSLIKSGYAISDAAIATGYDSISSFTHAIKKYIGCNPSMLKNS